MRSAFAIHLNDRGDHGDRWVALWMSLLAPGAGQGFLGAWGWAVVWAGMALGLVVFDQRLAAAGVALVSAWHAVRLGEFRSRSSRPVVGRVLDRPAGRRQMACDLELDLPDTPEEAWRRIADVRRFLTIDPFHVDVRVVPECVASGDESSRRGPRIILDHNLFGWRMIRVGRLLRWNPGRGYTFSDLSARSLGRGFPHVFDIRLEPLGGVGPCRTRLTIAIRGRWTANWVPVAVGRMWVRWVMREHARLLRQAW